jgi:hypothetical protein
VTTGADAVSWPAIDALHVEFEQCIAALRAAGEAMLGRALASLNEHFLRDFGAEVRWACGFTVIGGRRREHDMVIDVPDPVRRRCAEGERDIVRRRIDILPRWSEIHAGTHATALAGFLKVGEIRAPRLAGNMAV